MFLFSIYNTHMFSFLFLMMMMVLLVVECLIIGTIHYQRLEFRFINLLNSKHKNFHSFITRELQNNDEE
jgi:hypothetical protein